MKQTHTEGPWMVGPGDNESRITILGPRNGSSHVVIARMPGEYRETDHVFPRILAEAKLIAAAPMMFDALKTLALDPTLDMEKYGIILEALEAAGFKH